MTEVAMTDSDWPLSRLELSDFGRGVLDKLGVTTASELTALSHAQYHEAALALDPGKARYASWEIKELLADAGLRFAEDE